LILKSIVSLATDNHFDLDYFPDLPGNFSTIDFPEDKFLETKFFSKKFDKYFIVKSRKLEKKKDTLVYVHITREQEKGDDEC